MLDGGQLKRWRAYNLASSSQLEMVSLVIVATSDVSACLIVLTVVRRFCRIVFTVKKHI